MRDYNFPIQNGKALGADTRNVKRDDAGAFLSGTHQ